MNIEQAKAILGLSDKFTMGELKKAFRCMSKKCHPDINHTKNSEEKMKKINLAYDMLKKYVTKKEDVPINFIDIKFNKVNELKDILNNLKTYKIHDCNRKFQELYTQARYKEIDIYKEYIEKVKTTISIHELKEVERNYENRIRILLNKFIEKLFSLWEIDLFLLKFSSDFEVEINSLKEACKGKNINESLRKFNKMVNFVNEEDKRLFAEISEKFNNDIDDKILKYKDSPYYNSLSKKIEQLKRQILDSCMNIRTSYEYQKDKIKGEIDIKKMIDSIETKIEKLFSEYSLFENKKQEKLGELKLLSNNCPRKYIDKLNAVMDYIIQELSCVKDYNQLDIWFNNSKSEIEILLEKINKLVKEEDKQEQLNDIKNQLLLKFNSLKNTTIEEAQINSSILSRSLNCLLLTLNDKIEFENVLYLKQISFKDIETDESILNFITKKIEYVDMPYFKTAISDEKLLKLYEKIKPIVDIEDRKYLIREFALNELRYSSYLTDSNVTDEVRASSLETIGEFDCYHTISSREIFEPKIADVLSQMPGELVLKAKAFEIIGIPKLVKDMNSDIRLINSDYHLSKVRVYSMKK